MLPTLTSRDLERFRGVVPQLASAMHAVLADMEQAGHRMFIVQGVRTAVYQHSLWLQGRPGGPAGSKIVTMKDGFTHPSNHQPKADGYGYAVDCAFWNVKDPFDESLPWEMYGHLVEAAGLIWGGRWQHPHDSPHAELKYVPAPHPLLA